MNGLAIRLIALMLALVPVAAAAHDLGVARVTLYERASGEFSVEAKLPQNVEAGAPVFPAGCQVGEPRSRSLPRQNRRDSWAVVCEEPLRSSDRLVLPWRREGAAVQALWLDGSQSGRFFHADGDRIVVPLDELRNAARPAAQVAAHYLALGVEHILMGWDHLAFVLALCLIAQRWQLVKLITAFTLGHSLTLALAVLGWVQVPIPPVEACIALSVAFVAREALKAEHRLRHGAGLVFAFGLLHGLGFASALRESGIQAGELLLGLLMFNIGVELGQLLFVLAVATLVLAARRRVIATPVRTATAAGLGSLGMFWTFERIAGFGF